MEKWNLDADMTAGDRLAHLRNAIDASRNAPKERNISPMEIVVCYEGIIGRVEHFKRGGEHVFRYPREYPYEPLDNEREKRILNAYALRDEFLRIKEWSDAVDFLVNTGRFSPLEYTITWGEFQKWQRFIYLVQEHNQLAEAERNGQRGGEFGEVLKALTGVYSTSFFDSPPEPELGAELKAITEADPVLKAQLEKAKLNQESKRRKLYSWFREPPGMACSIRWVPKGRKDEQEIQRKLGAAGAMIEFLLPLNALKPVLLISTYCTLHAIAAAIYADRIHGVEYRACEVCNMLFKLGAHSEKKYCNREQCKNTAHQRKKRENKRKRLAAERQRASASTEKRKGRQK